MKEKNNVSANELLTKIYEIIYDDNFSDTEAVEKIITVLKKYDYI